MNMILDRLVAAKKQLDAAFKLELIPYHHSILSWLCVVAFVENGRPRHVDFDAFPVMTNLLNICPEHAMRKLYHQDR